MEQQNKTIIVLLIIILILGGIFVLRITGIIKFSNGENNSNVIKESIDDEVSIQNISAKSPLKTTNYERNLSFSYRISRFIIQNLFLIKISGLIISFAICLGISKLYKKLSMPQWTATFQAMYPIIILLLGLLGGVGKILNLIISIIQLIILCYYFMSLGMSKFWPLLPTITIVGIGASLSVTMNSGLITGAKQSSPSMVIPIILLSAGILAYIGASIKADIILAKNFEKGIGFTIGIILLPFIFKPILGYQRD